MGFTRCSTWRRTWAAVRRRFAPSRSGKWCPEQYLEQIIGTLRREGLVTSVRGAQGGYMLAREPSEITIGELMRLLEGPVLMADCLGDADACVRSGQCPSRLVWERLTDCINHVLDGITLQDMLNDHKEMTRAE